MKTKLIGLLLLFIVVFGFIIRVYKIDNTSLFGDELDFGYQALSIAQTGKDYYGHALPIYFRSLSEWKTGAFIYTLTPFVGAFGLNDYGVRLPSIIFGTLTLLFLYLLVKELTGNNFLALVSSFFLAIAPWHIHYSRIGFESSEMFFTYIAGLYFFYKAQKKPIVLVLSAFFFAVSFVVYRTQLVFVPLSIFLLILFFKKEIFSLPKKYLFLSSVVLLIISVPYAYQTFWGPGAERYSSLSIFDSQQMNNAVGILRSEDIENEGQSFLTKASGVIFHNKYVYYSNTIISSFVKSYSTEFLFVSGDTDPRQNIQGMGELYKFEWPFILVGLFLFVDSKISKKSKKLILSWIILSPLAASLTRDGANHATRLFMMLLPLSVMFSYGAYFTYEKLKTRLEQKVFLGVMLGMSLIFLVNFLHIYFVHYPSASEVWWQSGFKDAIKAVLSEKGNFDKIIISSADEPAQIYFLAWSSYPPGKFQQNLFTKKTELKNFGEVAELDNYLFPEVGVGKDLYSLARELPENYLYLATAKEISLDLVAEPQRVPANLKLIETIKYPSGRPAYYLLSQK